MNTKLFAGMVCCAGYAALVYWLSRFGADAIAITAWGVAPLLALLVTAALTKDKLSERLLVLLYVLAAIGAAMLLDAWRQGFAIVLATLPLTMFLFVGIAILTTAFLSLKKRGDA